MKLLDLPLDILIDNILYNLDARSLTRLSCTNSTLRRLVEDELLWKHRVFADYNLPHDSSFRHSEWKRLYSKLKDSVVYTWGDNGDGRLGHPPPARPINVRFNRDVYDLLGNHGRRVMRQNYASPEELVALRGKGIVDILSGGWSFHALDRHGRVWLWGRMHGDMVSRLSLGARLVSEPTQVQLPSNIHIQAISCGRSHTIALARDGSVWHWDNWQIVQRIRVAKPVVQVAANWGYSSLLTSQGELLRIDHPESVTNEDETLSDLEISESGVTLQSIEANAKANSLPFKPIEKGDKIVQIVGLEKFTLVLTRFGRVYKIKTEYQDDLTVASASVTTELTKYGATQQELNERGPGKKMHRFISAQFRNFAVYTTSQGSVLLGHQDNPPEQDPEVLEQLQHDICKVSFGDYHSGALTNQGHLLTWGANSNGAVGHGEAGMFVEPRKTPEPILTLRNMFVFAIGFGGWQSGALAIPRD